MCFVCFVCLCACACAFISHAGSVGQLSVSSDTPLSRASDGKADTHTLTQTSLRAVDKHVEQSYGWFISLAGREGNSWDIKTDTSLCNMSYVIHQLIPLICSQV